MYMVKRQKRSLPVGDGITCTFYIIYKKYKSKGNVHSNPEKRRV